MKRFLFFAFLIIIPFFTTAQSIWQSANTAQLDKITDDQKPIQPNKYDLYEIDAQALSDRLVNAVDRFSGGAAIDVDFPLGKDQFETFKIFTSGAISEELHTQYPDIQSYVGQSKSNVLNKIYFTITPKGFHGLITGEKILYMDPFSKVSSASIMIYNRKDLDRASDDNFSCGVDDSLDLLSRSSLTPSNDIQSFRDRAFRTYRIAVAATGEYTAYHDDGNAANGDAVADALAGIVTTITRVNSVFEKEMSIRFSLVGSNSSIIYTNDLTDPYDNYSGSQLLSVNTGVINGQIGSGSYDIGHVFSTGGGGIASAVRCTNNSKGRGVTGIVTPEFDPFDIDYVSHEIGHQFGASHTFYNGCFGGSPSTEPYETGSASTIMGYAGICAPNVQDNSDAYFHARSLQQMHAAANNDTCDTQISLGSNNPTAPNAVDLPTKFLPISTPFKLTVNSSQAPDAGEVYTYRWDQLDTGNAALTGATQPPVSSNTRGPMFRSKFATTDPVRYFPNLNELLDGNDDQWETLPSVTREMTFVSTIYDNNMNGGQTDQAEVVLKADTRIGPFVVNTPIGTDIWYEGEVRTVTWDVANTNQAAVALEVNVKLSLDGGYTYPFMLASNVSNSGSQSVTIPNGAKSGNARIMVEAVDNYFFNVNNGNFEIKEGTFELTATSNKVTTCKPTDATFSFDFNKAPNFTGTTNFSVMNLPAGLNASLSPASSTSSTTINVTITNTGDIDANKYDFIVRAVAGSTTIDKDFELKLFDNNVGNVITVSPTNGAGNQIANPLLEWEDLASASSYLVEVSEQSNFNTIIESSLVDNDFSYQTTLLNASKIYYWRVTPSNDCNSGSVASISLFQTAQDVCVTYDNETYVNNAQNASNQNRWNTSVNAVSAKVIVTDDIEVTNLSFYMRATHANTGHIKMQLSAPTGRFAEVYNRECAEGINFDLIVSDQGTQNFGCNPGYRGALTGNQKPGQAFSRFNNASALGEWVLLATDRTSGTGGTFNEFSVTVCGRLQYDNNISNNRNLGLTTSFNDANVIDQNLLRSVQPGFTNANLEYVITKNVAYGVVQLNGVDLNLGDSFTQGDLNNDRIQYVHNSMELSNTDSFGYTVLGGSSTVLQGEIFNITIEDPTLIYDAGSWTPFAPHLETNGINAQVIAGVASISVDALINNMSVNGGILSLESDATLTVLGNLVVDGQLNGRDGNLILSSATAQVVSGSGTLDLDTLELNNTSGVSFNAVTNIYNVLKPQSSTINANNNIVFKSNALTTGQLDEASAATINGSIKVERYIPSKRVFRFLASSVNSTGSIRENWQENGASVAGLGTHITGSDAASGFDVTGSGANSLFTFDNDNYTWSTVPNTNVEKLIVGIPIRMLVRGDRNVDLTNSNATPSITTLRSSGTVHTGAFPMSYTTDNGEFAMIANPYQAIVNFKSVLTDMSTTGFNENYIYVWDPNMNTRGGYVSVDMSSINGTPTPSNSDADKYLQPNQSVFVATTGASALTFKESQKTVSIPLTDVFSNSNQNKEIVITLRDPLTMNLLDQAVMRFNTAYDNLVDGNDAIKFNNIDETLAVMNGANRLSIEKRQHPVAGGTTPLFLSNYRISNYNMEVDLSINSNVTATLVDQETGSRTILVDGFNSISFTVGASGSAASRFLIEYDNNTLSLDETGLLSDISVYPNPVENNTFQLSSTSLLGKEITMNLYNTLGQKIYERTAVFNGTQTIKPTRTLSSGMYLLKIQTSDQSTTVQVIVK